MDINLAFSDDKNFDNCSGYSVLCKYIPDSRSFHVKRSTNSLFQKSINKVLRSNSISSWYQTSSANLEFLLKRNLRKDHQCITHLLWGERDLGYLDFLINLDKNILCCTFHGCADELPEIITKPHRLSKLSGVILMSDSQKSFFEEHNVPSHKIRTIHHGVDTDFFEPLLNGEKSREKKFKVLSVGNYRRDFSALKNICHSLLPYNNIEINIVASQANHHFFDDLTNVTCFSRISGAELLAMYQTSHCHLLCMEDATANNALLEGLACGLPVIAEAVGGIPEYTDQSCAFLGQKDNVEGLVISIIQLSQSPQKQREMSIAARQFALNLSWDKVADRTVDFYQYLQNTL